MAKLQANTFSWPKILVEAMLLPLVMGPETGRAARDESLSAAPAGLSATDLSPTADANANGGSFAGQRGGELYLAVEVNGATRGLAPFDWREGELWASAATLRQLGFVVPPETGEALRLNSLADLQVTYDGPGQRVTLMAPLRLLQLPATLIGLPGIAARRASASPGVLLNYDLFGLQAERGLTSLSALTELRAFRGAGVLGSTALTRTTGVDAGHWQSSTLRLDTTWSTSFPDRMLTLRVGDTLTGALPWTRATRIGGVQLSTNFALQPYRVTAPLPVFLGSATLPCDVELYVNGLRQYTGKVPAGPFQLTAMPNIGGAGSAQVVLTDTLGRATTLSFSLYATRGLLQQGLADWTVDLGAVRNNYGLRSNDYGSEPTASGTWRYGVTDSLTFETHGEATRKLVTAGLGGVVLMGQAGVLSGSVASSVHDGERGWQLNAGYNWHNEQLYFGLDATGTRGDYLDVASLYGTAPARGKGSASVGYSTREFGSFGLNWIHLQESGQPVTRYAGASWFRSIGQSTSLNLSVNQNLDVRSDCSIFLGITLALGGSTSVSSGVQRSGASNTVTLDARRTMPSEGGMGWRTGLRQGDDQRGGLAEIDYRGRYGQVAAGVDAASGASHAHAGASGALVLMGGHFFATRHIDDAFAVVSTDGIAGVPVTMENRVLGVTDEHGLLLIAPLRSYQNNQLGIDVMQMPADVRIDRVKEAATPSDRAGTLIRFVITPIRAASILLVDANGQALPLGSLVRLRGQPGTIPALVGFDGAVYLDTLEDHNDLDVETPSGACHLGFDHSRASVEMVPPGPLVCHP